MTYPKQAYDHIPRLNQHPVLGIQPMHEPTWLERMLGMMKGK